MRSSKQWSDGARQIPYALIRTYGKMLPSDYADNVDLVTTTDAHRAADLAGTVTIDATAPRVDLERQPSQNSS